MTSGLGRNGALEYAARADFPSTWGFPDTTDRAEKHSNRAGLWRFPHIGAAAISSDPRF